MERERSRCVGVAVRPDGRGAADGRQMPQRAGRAGRARRAGCPCRVGRVGRVEGVGRVGRQRRGLRRCGYAGGRRGAARGRVRDLRSVAGGRRGLTGGVRRGLVPADRHPHADDPGARRARWRCGSRARPGHRRRRRDSHPRAPAVRGGAGPRQPRAPLRRGRLDPLRRQRRGGGLRRPDRRLLRQPDGPAPPARAPRQSAGPGGTTGPSGEGPRRDPGRPGPADRRGPRRRVGRAGRDRPRRHPRQVPEVPRGRVPRHDHRRAQSLGGQVPARFGVTAVDVRGPRAARLHHARDGRAGAGGLRSAAETGGR
jgi:hypothetical protein